MTLPAYSCTPYEGDSSEENDMNNEKDFPVLERVPVRKAWPKEARDFTKRLESHIDVLSETLGFKLANVQREKAVGVLSSTFSVRMAKGGASLSRTNLRRRIMTIWES